MSRKRRPQLAKPHPLPPASDDVRRIIREELGEITKALALPRGAQATEVTAGYLQQLQQRNPRISGSANLTRDPYSNTDFGPGFPLNPAPLDAPLASGRPAPRIWEAPVSWNLQTTTTRTVPWSVLRDAADQVSIMRSCIETCKSAITGLDWSFGIDSARAAHLAKREGASSHTVTNDLQDKYADDIDRLHLWWAKPDRTNHLTFTEWLGAVMEDQLVLDAVALYPHLTMGGDLLSLEPIDSSTIKPLLDHRGATPQPPYAAYQQVLWGFPRGEWSAPSEFPADMGKGEYASAVYGPVTGVSARTDALIYKVRNRRTRGPYGFSNVEQALADVDLWLKRFDWLRSEYTAGVTPEMIVNVDATMTPEQLRQYEAVFNDDLSGRTNERHRAQFLPAGFNATYPQSHDAKFTSDFDLHIIRLICAAFDVLPTSLGFSPNHGGIGASGQQKGEQDSQLQRGTKPTAQWITDLINEVCTNYLGMPPEVTFKFHGLDSEDEQKEATLVEGYLNNGIMTLNETRDARSLPRYPFPQADQPFLATPTGPAFLNPEVQPVGMPGNLPSAPQNQPGFTPPAAVEPRDETVQDTPDPKAKAEQKAFLTFAKRRNGGEWRDFTFKALSPDVGEAANRLAAAGDLDACKALFTLRDG
jgi:Phage portal protein